MIRTAGSLVLGAVRGLVVGLLLSACAGGTLAQQSAASKAAMAAKDAKAVKVPPGHVLIPAGQRMVVELPAAEREYVLNEMRFQLDMLYVISEGLSRGT